MATFNPFGVNPKSETTEPQRSSNSRSMVCINVVKNRTEKPQYNVCSGRVSTGNDEDKAADSTPLVPKLEFDIGREGKNIKGLTIPANIPKKQTIASFQQHNNYSRFGSKTAHPPGALLVLKGLGASVWTKNLNDEELAKQNGERHFHVFHTASAIDPVVLSTDHLDMVAGASNFAKPLLDAAPAGIFSPWENVTRESHKDKPISKKGKKYNEYDDRVMPIKNIFGVAAGFNQGLDDQEELRMLLKNLPADSPDIVALQERTYPNQELCKETSGCFALPADRTVKGADEKFQLIIELTDKDDETKKVPMRAFKRIWNVLEWQDGAFATPGSKTTYAQVNLMAYDSALEPFGITNLKAWTTLGPQFLTYANYTIPCNINFSETANLPMQAELQDMDWQQALQTAGRTMDVEAIGVTFLIDIAHELIRLGVPLRAEDAKRHLDWTTDNTGTLKTGVEPSSLPTVAADKLPKFGSPVVNLSEFTGDPRPFFPADPAHAKYVFVALTNHKMNAARVSQVAEDFTREERAALMDYPTSVKLHIANKRNAPHDALDGIADESLARQGITPENSVNYKEIKSILTSKNFEGNNNSLYFNVFAIAHPLLRDGLTLTPGFREICGAMAEKPQEALADFHARFDWEAARVFGDHMQLTPKLEAERAKGDVAFAEFLDKRYGEGLASHKRARSGDAEDEPPAKRPAASADSMDEDEPDFTD